MKNCLLILLCVFTSFSIHANEVFKVYPENGDMTTKIQSAICEAGKKGHKSVVIELQDADYHLFRQSSTHKLYHISNTTSEEENPDPTKHIGLYLKDLENITIDGKGARLVMHGEITTFVLDGCRNVKLRNFTVAYADPTVVGMTVVNVAPENDLVRTSDCDNVMVRRNQIQLKSTSDLVNSSRLNK